MTNGNNKFNPRVKITSLKHEAIAQGLHWMVVRTIAVMAGVPVTRGGQAIFLEPDALELLRDAVGRYRALDAQWSDPDRSPKIPSLEHAR